MKIIGNILLIMKTAQSFKPEMATLFFDFFILERSLASLFDSIYSKYNLTTKQWLILAVATHIERPTITRIAEELKTSHQNVKAIALNLERVGLVNLIQDPADKRSTLVVGSNKLENLNKTRGTDDQDGMALLFGEFNAQELQDLSGYIERLLAQIEHIKGKIK